METKLKASVVINAYNEEDNIRDCFNSLKAQTINDFEIIFVDDGSTDDTVEIVKDFKDELRIKSIYLTHSGHRKARRRGISESESDIVVIIDADEILEADFLEKLIEPFDLDEIGAVGGVLLSEGGGWATRAYGKIQEVLYEFRTDQRGEVDWIQGGCSAYRKSALEEVGGLTEEKVSTDKDISWRIKDAGWKILLRKDAIGYHKDPSTLWSLMKREYKNGKKEYNLLKRHKGRMGWKEISRFSTLIGLLLLSVSPLFPPILLLIILGFFLTFLAVAYLIHKHIDETYLGISLQCWIVMTAINLGWSLGYLVSFFKRGADDAGM